jgi:hypothetical protein
LVGRSEKLAEPGAEDLDRLVWGLGATEYPIVFRCSADRVEVDDERCRIGVVD